MIKFFKCFFTAFKVLFMGALFLSSIFAPAVLAFIVSGWFIFSYFITIPLCIACLDCLMRWENEY